MPTRNVNLTEHYDSFIAAGVEAGRYNNASEVVGAALRLLELQEKEEQAKIEWLRAAVQEGFDAVSQGDYTVLDSPENIDLLIDTIHREVMADIVHEQQGV